MIYLIAEGNLEVVQATIGGVVQIVLAIVSGYFALRVAQANVPPQPPPQPPQIDAPESVVTSPKTPSIAVRYGSSILLLACAVIVGLLAFQTIGTAQQQTQLTKQNDELKTRGGAAAAQLNKITIKATYRKDDGLKHRIWIEAAPEILKEIHHVKYLFDDDSLDGPSLVDSQIEDYSSTQPFAIDYETNRGLLDYITLVVMYKGYKENGKMQAFAFPWEKEAIEIK